MPKINESSVECAVAEPHPEDVAAEKEGIDYAQRRVDGFFYARQAQFINLVSTYSDGEAQKLLDQLREEFWARTWLKPGDPDGS